MAVVMLGIAALFFLGHALGWFFKKTKVPDLLILIVIGYCIGPVMGWLKPSDFGMVGNVLTTLALVVILYEGGLHTRARVLVNSSGRALVLTLCTYGLSVVGALAVVSLFNFRSLETGLLVGLAIGSTSSAIVIPMVRMLSIREETQTLLALESAFTDVLAIVLTLVVLDTLKAEKGFNLQQVMIAIGPKTLFAIGFGIFFGLLAAFLRQRFPAMIPEAFAGEAWAVLTYALAELSQVNGALACLALGFTLGNLNLPPAGLKRFFPSEVIGTRDMQLLKEISLMLRVFFFLYLGLLMHFSNWKILLSAFGLMTVIYLGRYLTVRFVLRGDTAEPLDTMTTFAMAPRGLACAVVATLPMQQGHPEGEWIRDLIFSLIPMTIFATAVLVFMVEKERTRGWIAKIFPGKT